MARLSVAPKKTLYSFMEFVGDLHPSYIRKT